MRFLKIFLLFFQMVFAERSQTFVYFLESLLAPLTFFLFWRGAHFSSNNHWSLSSITSYYFLLAIISAVIMCYPEIEISRIDIQEGKLVSYLLRPFSYFGMRLFNTLGHRAFEACLSFILLSGMIFFYGNFFHIITNPVLIILSLLVAILGFLLVFTYKVILGILAFWFIETGGLFNISEMLIFIFAGFVVPINFFPQFLQNIAYMLPFSYMIYFPVIAFQGELTLTQLLQAILTQICWIIFLCFVCALVWRRGLKKFTGVGQ